MTHFLCFGVLSIVPGGASDFPRLADDCDRWAVVTTINPPTEGIQSTAALEGWCMVIVADTKTPDDFLKTANLEGREDIVFLSVEQQQQILHPFVKIIPFQSFARKNVGYLFAIRHGAKVIYDYDDDNTIQDSLVPFGLDTNSNRTHVLVRLPDLNNHQEASLAFNPLPYMNPSQEHIWPRGFPLDQLNHQPLIADAKAIYGSIDWLSVGVVQAVCDRDPDFDAVFRLTRDLPVYFDRNRKRPHRLMVPTHKYSPFNAQATVHMHGAFWGLFLPWSVPGRVTDIWRSYFTQKFLHELQLAVLYDPPLVLHDRSPHDYKADMQAENDLYFKTNALLKFLDKWDSNETWLPARLERLAIDLYERNYLGLDDVYGMQKWLEALLDVGYDFPSSVNTSVHRGSLFKPEPSLEGQPYLSSPRFNVAQDDQSYPEFLAKRSSTPDLFQEWLKDLKYDRRSSMVPVLKIVCMNKDEWPWIKDWVNYHGALIGFENLYILDGSVDSQSINFLAHVRDHYGVNVVFSTANLNELEDQLSRLGREISKSSDFVIKFDTDEFLVANTNDSTCQHASSSNGTVRGIDCTLSPYAVRETIQKLTQVADGDRLRIGYAQGSVPNFKVCDNDSTKHDLTAFPLSPVKAAGWFKTLSDARTLIGLDLGGHNNHFVPPFAGKGTPTKLSVLHFHGRCWSTEVGNTLKALISHNFVGVNDTDEISKEKLVARYDLNSSNPAAICQTEILPGTSWHKSLFYLKYLYRCIKEENFYSDAEEGLSMNLDFAHFVVENRVVRY